jgi:phospholipid/cholesterol/gamma-HCH transport system ATP-binding protein
VEKKDFNGPVLEAVAVDVLSTWNHQVRLQGVDWTVLPGEYWVIGGRHGTGKTDLLLTAAGLHRPTAGVLRLFGRDVTGLSEGELLQQRTRVGIVFKGGGRMFNELTVAENVALPVCYHRNCTPEEAQEEVDRTLEMTGLTPLAREKAQTLGIDWQQRVGLARALALKPEAVFLDEPAAGLDPRHRQWWVNFLAGLSGRKVTVIMTTNDFAPWHGEGHRYAMITDKRWRILGAQANPPQVE